MPALSDREALHALQIPRKYIDLQIDGVAFGKVAQRRHFTRMRDDIEREADIAVGNVIGSNIFNVAAILGTASVVSPLAIPSHVLTRELVVVVAMSLLLFPILRTRWRIRRWEGALLLACYVGAVTWLL